MILKKSRMYFVAHIGIDVQVPTSPREIELDSNLILII